MPKKTLRIVLTSVMFLLSLSAAANIRPPQDISPTPPSVQAEAEESIPVPKPDETHYKLILSDEALFLYTLDKDGTELSISTIDYIDIYSLFDSQIEILRKGAQFDSREAAAEFIQDLGS